MGFDLQGIEIVWLERYRTFRVDEMHSFQKFSKKKNWLYWKVYNYLIYVNQKIQVTGGTRDSDF